MEKKEKLAAKKRKDRKEKASLLCLVHSVAAKHFRDLAAVGQLSNGWTEMLVMQEVQVGERRWMSTGDRR